MNLLRAASTISLFTLASRVTGLVRDIVISSVFGAGASFDAFNVAFRIPNLLRRLFGEGAFSQAFVPTLARARAADGDEATRQLIDAVATVLFSALVVTCVVGVVAAPVVVWLMASGLERFDDAVVMTRVMFPYIGFISLVSLSAGVLNTWQRFAVPAATPVLLNLAMIAAVWLLVPVFARAGIERDLRAGGRRDAGRRAAARGPDPGARARSASCRASALGLRSLARRLAPPGRAHDPAPDGAGAARRLGRPALDPDQHPDRLAPGRRRRLVAVLRRPADGVPDLAARRRPRRGAHPAAVGGAGPRRRRRPTRACSTGACAWRSLLALPCAAALLVFPEALVATLFQRGKFDALAAAKTAYALRGYGVGLVGLIGVKILAPGFYARQDIRTPVTIAVIVLALTQAMNAVFVPLFGHAGLALSVSLGATINAVWLSSA